MSLINGPQHNSSTNDRCCLAVIFRCGVVANLAIAFSLCCSGCATLPYSYGTAHRHDECAELAAVTGSPIERGRPNRFLDTVGWIWGIPGKVLLFDRRVENHQIGANTEASIARYLNDNALNTVKVRINQYHPGDDWRRLVANKSVGPGWRYTLGTLSVVAETLIPGRVFGGDHYNPFTNTVHLYSDIPAIAIHEAGHAKDFAGRHWKGTYAAAYLIPGVPLYHEARATGDALGYIRTTGSVQDHKEAYEILYPAYGTYVGNAVSGYLPFGYLGGVIGGHIVGRWKSYDLGSHAQSQPANHKDVQQASYSEEPGFEALPVCD
ncbi:MAG: hypothetical protein R3C59_28960 [Planctomycetaceae bacterium]